MLLYKRVGLPISAVCSPILSRSTLVLAFTMEFRAVLLLLSLIFLEAERFLRFAELESSYRSDDR